MPHLRVLSESDARLLVEFERGLIAPERFDHRHHLRVAYCLLSSSSDEESYSRLKAGLLLLLSKNGLSDDKFHVTLTKAWLQAVRYFIELPYHSPDKQGQLQSPPTCSLEFLEQNDQLLDSKVMYTHYSRELIEQERSRLEFVHPDLDPIPVL